MKSNTFDHSDRNSLALLSVFHVWAQLPWMTDTHSKTTWNYANKTNIAYHFIKRYIYLKSGCTYKITHYQSLGKDEKRCYWIVLKVFLYFKVRAISISPQLVRQRSHLCYIFFHFKNTVMITLYYVFYFLQNISTPKREIIFCKILYTGIA